MDMDVFVITVFAIAVFIVVIPPIITKNIFKIV